MATECDLSSFVSCNGMFTQTHCVSGTRGIIKAAVKLYAVAVCVFFVIYIALIVLSLEDKPVLSPARGASSEDQYPAPPSARQPY